NLLLNLVVTVRFMGMHMMLIVYLAASNGDAYTRTDGINPSRESTGVKSGTTNLKPALYEGATKSFSSQTNKGKGFRQLESKDVCDEVELSIPIKVVETGATKSFSSQTNKGKGFRQLESKGVCDEVELSIPIKVVETVFLKDGISLIATKIGKLVMLDSYTSDDI
nr:hypothetical protein [Tanacetum cinerariifolium]